MLIHVSLFVLVAVGGGVRIQRAHGGERSLGVGFNGAGVGLVLGRLHGLYGGSRAREEGDDAKIPLHLRGVGGLGQKGFGAGAERGRQLARQTLQDRGGVAGRGGRFDVVFSGHDRKIRPERAPLIH